MGKRKQKTKHKQPRNWSMVLLVLQIVMDLIEHIEKWTHF